MRRGNYIALVAFKVIEYKKLFVFGFYPEQRLFTF